MKQLISLKQFRYAGKRLRRGDVFRARTGQDERLLVAIGSAEEHVTPAPVVPPAAAAVVEQARPHFGYAAKVLASEPAGEVSERTGKPKRQYKRRDLTAED
jgi:hypothetical protein